MATTWGTIFCCRVASVIIGLRLFSILPNRECHPAIYFIVFN